MSKVNTLDYPLKRGTIPAEDRELILADLRAGLAVEAIARKHGRKPDTMAKYIKELGQQEVPPAQQRRTLQVIVEVPIEDVQIRLPNGIVVPLALPAGLDSTNTTAFMLQLQHIMDEFQVGNPQTQEGPSTLEQALHASPPTATEDNVQRQLRERRESRQGLRTETL